MLKSTSIVEVEKRKMLIELEDRAKELDRERDSQFSVAAKIRAMQSKLLSGNNSLLDKTRQQQEMLQSKRIELAEQKVFFILIYVKCKKKLYFLEKRKRNYSTS